MQEDNNREVEHTDVSVKYVKLPAGLISSGIQWMQFLWGHSLDNQHISGIILAGGPGEGIFVEDVLTSGQLETRVMPGYIGDTMDTGHLDTLD